MSTGKGVLVVIGLICLLQFTLIGLFFHSLSTNKIDLARLQVLSQQQETLNKCRTALLLGENMLNRAELRYILGYNGKDMGEGVPELLTKTRMILHRANADWVAYLALESEPRMNQKVLEQVALDFKNYSNALYALTDLLAANNFEGVRNLPAQSFQDNLEKSYNLYTEENTRIYHLANEELHTSFHNVSLMLVFVLLVMQAILLVLLISLLSKTTYSSILR